MSDECIINVIEVLPIQLFSSEMCDQRKHCDSVQEEARSVAIFFIFFFVRSAPTISCCEKGKEISESCAENHVPKHSEHFANFLIITMTRDLVFVNVPSVPPGNLIRSPSSRRNVMVGGGEPVAEHFKVVLLPSLTTISLLVG